MSDNTCSICLEPLLGSEEGAGEIGTAVPCGHCFHMNCFGAWQASKGSRCKCPNCNKPTTKFVKIFISMGEDNYNNGGDDDTLSLSSIEEEEEVQQQQQQDKRSEEEKESEGPSQESSEKPSEASQMSQNEAISSQNTVTIDDDDDDDGIPQSLHADVVDLTMTPEKPSPKNRKRRHGNNGDGDDGDIDFEKMKKIAKRYKRRFQQKQSQCEEFGKKQSELVQKLSSTKEELESKEERIQDLQADNTECNLELEHRRLVAVRCSNELSDTKKKLNDLRSSSKQTQDELNRLKENYKKDIKRENIKSMAEVKDLTDDYKKTQVENDRLKVQLQMYRRKFGTILSDESLQKNGKNKRKKKGTTMIEKLRQMDTVRNIPSSNTAERNNNDASSHNEEKSRSSGSSMAKYSSQAARLVAGTHKKHRKQMPKAPPQTALAGNPERQKMDRNKEKQPSKSIGIPKTSLNFGTNKKKQKIVRAPPSGQKFFMRHQTL